MSHQSGSSPLQLLFEIALQDYERQTGITLDKHPLASQLQSCDSIESVTAVLCEQTQAFNELLGRDKILKPLKNAVSALYKLSAVADFGRSVGLVRPYWALTGRSMFLTLILQHFLLMTAIHTCLGILLSVCATP